MHTGITQIESLSDHWKPVTDTIAVAVTFLVAVAVAFAVAVAVTICSCVYFEFIVYLQRFNLQ
jgi:hypothetical protein